MIYLQRHGFIQQILMNIKELSAKKEGRALIRDLWDRLEAQYLQRRDGNHFTAEQVAAAAVDYLRERRRANIYQIAVECYADARCVDAKTFYSDIGGDKVILNKFLQKMLKNTQQIDMESVHREWSGERIHFLLSSDADDNNIEFEEWLSGLVYDPVTLWLNEREIREFVATDNLHDTRCIKWGKDRFVKYVSR